MHNYALVYYAQPEYVKRVAGVEAAELVRLHFNTAAELMHLTPLTACQQPGLLSGAHKHPL